MEVGGELGPSDFDVIVVGGGPAGSTAAIQCVKAGLRTALVEKAAFPRDHPGETLHPGIEPLLDKLGAADLLLSANFLRHEGNWVKWQKDLVFTPFGEDASGPWRGFQAWRADFDSLLLSRAQELGVHIFQPSSALKPILRGTRVSGVTTPMGEVTSLWTIDASGSQHWLANQLGLSIERHSPLLIARYGYAEGICPSRDVAPAIISDETGWTWTAKVRPNLYQWTRLSWEREMHDKQWLPQEFKELRPLHPPRGADVTWRIVTSIAGGGYFIAGDAAAVLDPASSHGVLKGIMSGMMAAHTISLINNRHLEISEAIAGYNHWLRDWFLRDVANLRNLYSQLQSPPKWITTFIPTEIGITHLNEESKTLR